MKHGIVAFKRDVNDNWEMVCFPPFEDDPERERNSEPSNGLYWSFPEDISCEEAVDILAAKNREEILSEIQDRLKTLHEMERAYHQKKMELKEEKCN